MARAVASVSLPLLGISISSAMSGRLTLPARLRLRHKSDFDSAYSRGRRISDGFFSVTARANDADAPRLGLAVAVKAAGGAVPRNRLRRIIRESFRLHQHTLPAVDVVVSARAAARSASAEALRASLTVLWKKVAEQCATSSLS